MLRKLFFRLLIWCFVLWLYIKRSKTCLIWAKWRLGWKSRLESLVAMVTRSRITLSQLTSSCWFADHDESFDFFEFHSDEIKTQRDKREFFEIIVILINRLMVHLRFGRKRVDGNVFESKVFIEAFLSAYLWLAKKLSKKLIFSVQFVEDIF